MADILIAHPGKHHALHLVAGCIRTGATVKYVTPFYSVGLGRLVAAMPGYAAAKAGGYAHSKISSDIVESPFWWQIKKLCLPNKKLLSFYRDFDEFVARKITRGDYQGKLLVTLQDYMPSTVRAAKKRGFIIWSDQISNQSQKAMARVLGHEQALGIESGWQHSESSNNDVIHLSDVITVPSSYCLNGIKNRISSDTYTVTIPYGASAKDFSLSHHEDSEQIVILARAQSIRKGGHLLIDALKQCGSGLLLACAPKGIKVIILGSLEPLLEAKWAALELPKGITLQHGNIPHSKVAQLYQQASLFVMPSLSESFSLACLEAMHAGLPLIITKYCGVDGFQNEKMGYEVSDSSEDLASSLVKAFNNQHLWREWGGNAKCLAKGLTWENYEMSISQLAKKFLI